MLTLHNKSYIKPFILYYIFFTEKKNCFVISFLLFNKNKIDLNSNNLFFFLPWILTYCENISINTVVIMEKE